MTELKTATANTASGPVVGREKQGALLFAGLPYAAPPVGGLRFQAAQAHPGWSEPRQCFKFGPAAPQVASGGMTDSASVRWDEDCLTLNISTPAIDQGQRSVLVWIHGGAYRTGQSSVPWYNGTRFAADQDIVVVSINYRLGALGFTDLSRFGAKYATSGANGILDQIFALEWVRDNIANFGGDPAKVTIAGESAGAYAVSTLLGCARADGLYRAAIPQSGGPFQTLPATAGKQVADAFLAALGADTMMAVEAMSAEALLAAQVSVCADLESGPGLSNKLGGTVAPFYPVEGNEVLPQSPLSLIEAGHNAQVPVLTGSNQDETTLWGYGKVDAAKLDRAVASIATPALLETYKAQLPEASLQDLMIAITTDFMFRLPAIRLAELRAAQGGETWLYQFNWASREPSGRLKATHALEIPFAFNNLHQAGVDAFIGPGEKPQHVADKMHDIWSRFVRGEALGWSAYEPGKRTTMVFDDVSNVAENPGAAQREAWAKLR